MAPIPDNSDPWSAFSNSAPSTDNNSLQTLSDEDNSSDPFKSWIYAPLIAFMLIALAIVIVQFRRRRSKVIRDITLRQAITRDIQGLRPDPRQRTTQRIYIVRTGPDGRTPEVAPAAGRRVRAGGLGLRPSRWQWSLPTTGPRRSPEEGLNELGEAPPPYDAAKDAPIPLNDTPRTSEALSRISEEPRNPAAGQQDGADQQEESTTASMMNTDNTNTTTTNTTGTDYTTTASSSMPAASVTRNEPASEPSVPPPAYVRYA